MGASSARDVLRQDRLATRPRAEHLRGYAWCATRYNLILAELTLNEDLIEEYQSKLASWADMLTGRMSVLRKWDRNDAWTCVESEGARVPRATRDFIEAWCGLQ